MKAGKTERLCTWLEREIDEYLSELVESRAGGGRGCQVSPKHTHASVTLLRNAMLREAMSTATRRSERARAS